MCIKFEFAREEKKICDVDGESRDVERVQVETCLADRNCIKTSSRNRKKSHQKHIKKVEI
jgi:hypothetical protein